MTCHANPDNEIIIIGAQWAADQPQPTQSIVQELMARFGLSNIEAVEAAAMAERFKICRKAFG
ncbi:hypothetical protein [Sinorhizobium fredii]|nr:hypothetical protein [Sinorhizobium fredii]